MVNIIPKLARFSALMVVVLVFSMVVPDVFTKATSSKVRPPTIYYSAPLERFVMQQGKEYHDEYGAIMGQREFRRALPFIFHSDLVKWGEFPSLVNGVAVTPALASKQLQFMRVTPRDINVPHFDMHMLLESNPDGANLEYAPDMFLLGNGIEFRNCEDNSVNVKKSEAFTKVVLDVGFQFPARLAGGNPDVRKAFDWGYFLIDSTNTLFHLMMVNGEPMCINTGNTFTDAVRYIAVAEHNRHEFYGAVATDKDVFLISCDKYNLIKLPLLDYNPDVDSISILTTPLNRIVQQRTKGEIFATAMNVDWEPVALMEQQVDKSVLDSREKAAALLFPFKIETGSSLSKFKLFNIQFPQKYLTWTLSGIFLSLIGCWLYTRLRFRMNPKWYELAFLIPTGLYGLIALIFVGGWGYRRK
ncbi:MAG: DUF4857 domain-containing protein [Desulfovibrio sp.]